MVREAQSKLDTIEHTNGRHSKRKTKDRPPNMTKKFARFSHPRQAPASPAEEAASPAGSVSSFCSLRELVPSCLFSHSQSC